MPDAITLPACSILLLAGGQGQRMGGRDKGLILWNGEPLIQHLHRLTRPLTDDLLISCNRNWSNTQLMLIDWCRTATMSFTDRSPVFAPPCPRRAIRIF